MFTHEIKQKSRVNVIVQSLLYMGFELSVMSAPSSMINQQNVLTTLSLSSSTDLKLKFQTNAGLTTLMLVLYVPPPSVSPGHAIRGRGLSPSVPHQFGHEMLP